MEPAPGPPREDACPRITKDQVTPVQPLVPTVIATDAELPEIPLRNRDEAGSFLERAAQDLGEEPEVTRNPKVISCGSELMLDRCPDVAG